MILRIEPAVISITLDKINTAIGTNISSQQVLDIFNALKFDVSVEGETFIVTVPTRRGDITIEADLVEEVARLYGYDNIPSTLPVGYPYSWCFNRLSTKTSHCTSYIRRCRSLPGYDLFINKS